MPDDLDLSRRKFARALQQSDDLALHFHCTDAAGQRTTRIVSPIRLVGHRRVQALCLLRNEVRQFDLARITDLRFVLAADVVAASPTEGT